MAENINSSVANESGALKNGLPGQIMRVALENKGLLSARGSMYVGTGSTNDITIQTQNGESVQYSIPETEAVVPLSGGVREQFLVYAPTTSGSGVSWSNTIPGDAVSGTVAEADYATDAGNAGSLGGIKASSILAQGGNGKVKYATDSDSLGGVSASDILSSGGGGTVKAAQNADAVNGIGLELGTSTNTLGFTLPTTDSSRSYVIPYKYNLSSTSTSIDMGTGDSLVQVYSGTTNLLNSKIEIEVEFWGNVGDWISPIFSKFLTFSFSNISQAQTIDSTITTSGTSLLINNVYGRIESFSPGVGDHWVYGLYLGTQQIKFSGNTKSSCPAHVKKISIIYD